MKRASRVMLPLEHEAAAAALLLERAAAALLLDRATAALLLERVAADRTLAWCS